MINGELHRAKRISSDFNTEVVLIRKKFKHADFPVRFTESVIKQFKQLKQPIENLEDEFIIPPNFFDEPKPTIFLRSPFCNQNEIILKQFLKKFHQFSKHKFDIKIVWNTRKVKTLFRIKDKNPHPSCKIYEGVCSCNETYIGETKRNVEVRWCEHNNPKHQSEPAKHIKDNIEHQFIWKILCDAPDFYQTRKTLESFFIRTKRPTLNDQLENQLLLFRNGIT